VSCRLQLSKLSLAQLRTVGPTLQTLLRQCPQEQQLPSACSPRAAAAARGCSCGSIHRLCLLQASSTAALGLLRGCTGRSARDRLLLPGPLLGCRELLLRAWSTTCPPFARPPAPAGLLFTHCSLPLSQLLSHSGVSSLNSALPEHTQHHSGLSSGSGGSLLELLCYHGALLGSAQTAPHWLSLCYQNIAT